MKIALFGHAGQLGTRLHAVLAAQAEVFPYDREQLDIGDSERLRETLAAVRPDVIVNAAAYTAVDQAENDAATAARINADAPRVMGEAAAATGALLIHYSTDYVFDGGASEPYTEEAATAPLGVYGQTKLAGEQAIRDSGAVHLILRTAWLYSNRGKNFLNTMLRLAEERAELRVVADQFGSPTYADQVAEATGDIIGSMQARGDKRAALAGTYHIACGGVTSWHAFAQRIMEKSGKHQVRVAPITTADYPTAARRPAYSALDSGKLARAFGIRLPFWEDALQACLDERARSR